MNHLTLRILVIDDDQANLRLLTSQLRQIGRWHCVFWSYTDVHQAMEDLADRLPDVILIDSHAGQEQGDQALEVIRRTGCRTPAIILCDEASETSATHRAGTADYLDQQQVTAESLEQAILGALRRDRFALYLEEHRRTLAQVNQNLHRRKRSVPTCFDILANELLRPIGALQEFLDSLAGDSGLSLAMADGRLRQFQNAMANCGGLGQLVQQMIENVRMEEGFATVSPANTSPTNIRELTTGCLRGLASEFHAQGVKVDASVSPNLMPVMADTEYLPRVLADAIGFALRGCPEGGSVRVRATDDGDHVRLTVVGGNPDLTAEAAAAMLNPTAPDGAPSAHSPWAEGLTLRVARALLVSMGGSLHLAADPGHGARITLHLTTMRPTAGPIAGPAINPSAYPVGSR